MELTNQSRWTEKPAKSRSKMVSFRVTTDELHELEIEAERLRVSVSDLVRQALERMLKGQRGQ